MREGGGRRYKPGGVSDWVVLESNIVRPTQDLGLQHLVDVEPEVVPVTGLGAPPVAGGLVEPGLYLRAPVPRDQDDGVERNNIAITCQ